MKLSWNRKVNFVRLLDRSISICSNFSDKSISMNRSQNSFWYFLPFEKSVISPEREKNNERNNKSLFSPPPSLSLSLSFSFSLSLSLPISFLDNHQPEAENSLYVGTAAFNLVLESIFCPPTSKTYSVVEMVDSVEEYLWCWWASLSLVGFALRLTQ